MNIRFFLIVVRVAHCHISHSLWSMATSFLAQMGTEPFLKFWSQWWVEYFWSNGWDQNVVIYSESEFFSWQQPSFGAWLTCFIPPIMLVPCLSVLMLLWFVSYFNFFFPLAIPPCFVLFFFLCVKNPRDVITLVPHSNLLFLEQERGDGRQNPNKPKQEEILWP